MNNQSKHLIINIIFLFFIVSCTKPTINDFTDEELYEVQGIITKLTRTSYPFDSSNIKVMNYIYHLDYDIPLEGVEDNFDLVFTVGTPIIVLVSKENPKISFFSHYGYLDNRLYEIEEQDTIFLRSGAKLFKFESAKPN